MVRTIQNCSTCHRSYVSATGDSALCLSCRITDAAKTKDQERTSFMIKSSCKSEEKSNENACKESKSLRSLEDVVDFTKPSKKQRVLNLPTRAIEEKATKEKKVKYCLSDPRYECIICGSLLVHITSGIEGKLNHINRCAKKHSVSLKDIQMFKTSETQDSVEKISSLTEGERKSSDNTMPSQIQDNSHLRRIEVIDLLSSDDESEKQYLALNESTAKTDQLTSEQTPSHCPVKKNSTQPVLTNFFKAPVKSINNVLLEGAKKLAWAAKNKPTSNSTVTKNSYKKRQWNNRDYSKATCPEFKKIPHTTFICDGFHYAKSSLSKQYFLTHFHSDHYGGITSKWNAGTIYCSLPTANLVHEQLGVSKDLIHPLPMMTPIIIVDKDSANKTPVKVTLLDANHCPGAIMFLFQIGTKRILHVGDFRWHKEKMRQLPPLEAFISSKYRLDELMLDTTYCNKKYAKLPTQEEAIRAAIQVMHKEMNDDKSVRRAFFKNVNNTGNNECSDQTLFLFGAYSIGKERIYMSAAKHFKKKICVDSRRLKMIKAFNWPDDEMKIFTTNKSESNLWVVPLGHINFDQMTKYMKQKSSKTKGLSIPKIYRRVVGFRPTGWTFSPNRNEIISKRTSRQSTIYGVPYSEHSNFSELVDCLFCLKPRKITPTVGVSKSNEQCQVLLDAVKDLEYDR